jgi:hypothetical protein
MGGELPNIFHTLGHKPLQRFDYWHDVLCSRFVPAKSVNECERDFDATLTTPDGGSDRDQQTDRACAQMETDGETYLIRCNL